jgi:hypothetical protein
MDSFPEKGGNVGMGRLRGGSAHNTSTKKSHFLAMTFATRNPMGKLGIPRARAGRASLLTTFW